MMWSLSNGVSFYLLFRAIVADAARWASGGQWVGRVGRAGKGCSRCGLITDIGGSKTFTCQHCGFVAPRDAKSARDILAKHIVSPA